MSLPRLTLLLFLALQLVDGVITYEATSLFGTVAEGNPILTTWMHLVGIAPTLIAAKLLACACGVFIYSRRSHFVLAALTVSYGFGAVLPWLRTLSAL